jgi:hypothetical protein
MSASLIERWGRVFATELAGAPAMTLRGGDALDEYRQAPVYDAAQGHDESVADRTAVASASGSIRPTPAARLSDLPSTKRCERRTERGPVSPLR